MCPAQDRQNDHIKTFRFTERKHYCNIDFFAKAALKFGNEAWVLKKGEEQRLEVAQIKFLRHVLGITKLDKEKN